MDITFKTGENSVRTEYLEKKIELLEKKISKLTKQLEKLNEAKELTSALEFLDEDFNKTKELIVKLTYHLDEVEFSYNKILEEYKNRTK
jgi:prefoldin subunit 5